MNLPFWPFYVGDYLADTMHLDAHEHGAYLLLMMAYWKRQKPLDDDPKDLAQIAHLSLSDFEKCRSRLAPFFKIEGGKWVHGRLERDILKQKLKYNAQSQAARKTNEKRYGQQEMSLSDSLSVSLSVSQPEPEPEPEPKSESEPKKSSLPAPLDTVNGKRHAEFVKGWCLKFQAVHRFPYAFSGGKDGQQLKNFLDKVDLPTSTLLSMAEKAWGLKNEFLRSNSSTIHGFCTQYNQIVSAIRNSAIL